MSDALAVLSGIEEKEIRQIESGISNFYIETLMQLAETLNVDLCCLAIDPGCSLRY